MERATSFSKSRTMDKVIDLLEVIKYDHLDFLLNKWGIFPECCDVSSELLACYLRGRFEDVKLYSGTFLGNTHWWIEVAGTKIDFTVFQFMLNTIHVNYNINVENLYSLCVVGIQGGFIVQDRLSGFYQNAREVEPRFSNKNYSNHYSLFLQEVSLDENFKDRFSYGFECKGDK